MVTFGEVFDAAKALSTDDRLRLVEALWDDIPVSDWPTPTDEWIAEAQRRSAEYDSGSMLASSWPEVRQRARRKAGLDG